MSQDSKLTSQIAILGAGDVGATVAYSLIVNPVAGDILIVDPKEEVRNTQVHINRAWRNISEVPETHQCTDESRTDLIGRNKAILETPISYTKPFRPDIVLPLVANPVDVLTYFAQQFSKLPRQQVIGSGTFLDSVRLRGILALKAEVAASSINAYVQGEHGKSQFVAWSLASIRSVPLDRAFGSNQTIDKNAITEETKNKATNIAQNKVRPTMASVVSQPVSASPYFSTRGTFG